MNIRRAKRADTDRLNELLFEVGALHAEGRPDIFRKGAKKYTDEELFAIIDNDLTPIFVAVDEDDCVMGYAFCIYEEMKDSILLHDMKALYIDDLCVDGTKRGLGIGRALFEHVLNEARNAGCYHITLNVWKLNEGALKFYEKCGLKPLKTVMEKII